ncbi:hypothetical protein GOP47_0006418 [Adiantum capillus-veneris]|uniref:Zinc finger PHD-type domain-containing protein n=1 Tax=Adiantum capillus-veneris TaxID=13818 RepID=A0A9D4V4C6_ADICA|nr:hypothetical protein GOP47_0006418 [Adiantum capillus-veneris]
MNHTESDKDKNTSGITEHATEPTMVHLVERSNYPALIDIAVEPVSVIVDWMCGKPDELSEDLKAELREILNGNGGVQHREEFALLQKSILSRSDLTSESLALANRAQLEILVAIKTGIQAFLLPDISLTQSALIEVFLCKRCRNMACQNLLPGDECKCEVCCTKSGFCNGCMCTICSKFDFDVNTCHWIGCDVCFHWTHTDCAIRVGRIAMGTLLKGADRLPEMLFECTACKHTSELLGWAKDAFHTCAGKWEKEALMKEFDCVRRIFHGSKDSKGRRLFWKLEELLGRLKGGLDTRTACNEIQQLFAELEKDDKEACESQYTNLIEPHEACARIAEVVDEAVMKIEVVADEKVRALKRAHITLEACDKELEEKRLELQEMQMEREKRKLEVEVLEMKMKLRVAEAEIFQARADDARRKAEVLRHLVAEKGSEAGEDQSKYVKLRLDEVEAKRRDLLAQIQLQEHFQRQLDPSQMLMVSRIQDVLKQVSQKGSVESRELPSAC